jgi:cytochrome d ubiquinol oxidase subunit I
MDAVMLSRLQFALTSMFHWVFVPLTLGLSILTAYMETRYVMSGDETYLKMTKFWGRLFLINFALGVVTGITLEFQFGMNWAEYSKYVGDIFGALLAIEATAAFFLESVFIGVWIFGWDKISKKAHAGAMWLIAIATNLSALWILLANGWMQNPVGYVIRNNRAEMTDFVALITNPYGWLKFFHTVTSGYVVAAFFVMGISAYHLLKNSHADFFKRSFKIAAVFGLVASLLVALVGDFHAVNVAKIQPTKFAAMEAQWETQKNVGFAFFMVPDEAGERNILETPRIPGLMSYLAYQSTDAEIKGLKSFPKSERPPVAITFWSFRVMVAMGFGMILLTIIGVYLAKRDLLQQYPAFLWIMLFSIPLPYIAGQLGWIVAEVGRQPWIVYGVLKTSDAVSKSLSTVQIYASLVGFTVLYTVLGAVDIYLLAKFSKKGPDDNVSTLLKS